MKIYPADIDEDRFMKDRREKFLHLLERAAKILCEKRKPGDHFYLYPTNASSILRLELIYKKGNDLELLFLFPRHSQFKPIYKDVREWFAKENLEWKDRTVQGERFMAAIIPREETEIVRLVISFMQDNFEYDVLQIWSKQLALTTKLTNMKFGIILMCIILLFGSVGTFLVHQLLRLNRLNWPTYETISKYEISLIIIYYCALLLMFWTGKKHISQHYGKPVQTSKARKYFWRGVLLLSPLFIASLTG